MTGGIYTAAAGLAAQQALLDSLSNDIANVNTPGYRPGRVAFTDLLYQQEGGVSVGSGVGLTDLGRSATQGSLQPSTNPLAVAIEGPGFLQVKRSDGTVALTRAGDLQVDSEGTLVTPSGNPVEPRIQLPKGTDPAKVVIGEDGTVNADGQVIGKIAVVDVVAPNGLISIGGGLLQATAASGATAPVGSKLTQGMVEASGVDIATAMTSMIEAQRAYALQSRVIKTHDTLAQIANDIRR
jgi:flagellar basal-body rod protein FlgG